MELQLHRVDLLQTAATSRGALAVRRAGAPAPARAPVGCRPGPRARRQRELLHADAARARPPTPPQVLPPGEKKTQKVAVGDAAGVVQVFSMKRGGVALSFKSMPGPHKARRTAPRAAAAPACRPHAPTRGRCRGCGRAAARACS